MAQHGNDGLAVQILSIKVFLRLLDVIAIKLKKSLFIGVKNVNMSKLK
jgi:hypothetical protein